MVKTQRTYNLMLLRFFLVSNKSKGARRDTKNNARNTSWPSMPECFTDKWSSQPWDNELWNDAYSAFVTSSDFRIQGGLFLLSCSHPLDTSFTFFVVFFFSSFSFSSSTSSTFGSLPFFPSSSFFSSSESVASFSKSQWIQRTSSQDPSIDVPLRTQSGPPANRKWSSCLAWPFHGPSPCLSARRRIRPLPTPRCTVYRRCSCWPHEPCPKPNTPKRTPLRTVRSCEMSPPAIMASIKPWYQIWLSSQDSSRARSLSSQCQTPQSWWSNWSDLGWSWWRNLVGARSFLDQWYTRTRSSRWRLQNSKSARGEGFPWWSRRCFSLIKHLNCWMSALKAKVSDMVPENLERWWKARITRLAPKNGCEDEFLGKEQKINCRPASRLYLT